MRKVLKKGLVILNIVFSGLLLLSYLSVYINPNFFWPMSFLGLGYPVLLILNLFFLVFWIYRRRIFFLIPLVCIILGWNILIQFIRIPLGKKPLQTEDVNSIKVLSFNIQMLNLYDEDANSEFYKTLMELIATEDPDIICFQEYFATLRKNSSPPGEMQKYYKPATMHIQRAGEGWNYGIAIFSKYPVLKRGQMKYEDTDNLSIFTDLLIDDDTIRVLNNHLQSVRFNKRDYELMDSIHFFYEDGKRREIKNLSRKLKGAFLKRAAQAELLSGFISSSPYPVVVCGDFNDSPVSYSYHKIKGDLQDAFVVSGKGIGSTYSGKLPFLRIDYILYSPELQSRNYKRPLIKLSDHYPVMCEILIPD